MTSQAVDVFTMDLWGQVEYPSLLFLVIIFVSKRFVGFHVTNRQGTGSFVWEEEGFLNFLKIIYDVPIVVVEEDRQLDVDVFLGGGKDNVACLLVELVSWS